MHHWANITLVSALIAGLLGLTGAAGESAKAARVLLWGVIVLMAFLAGVVYCLAVGGRRPSLCYLPRGMSGAAGRATGRAGRLGTAG